MTDVKLDWDVKDIMDKIEKMGKDATKFESSATMEAAQVVKAHVESNLPRSDVSKIGYKHMKDHVIITSLKEDETLTKVRKVKGGKSTGYKWKWLEYGTSNMNATNFLTKSMKESNKEVTEILNEAVKKALDL